MLDILAITGPIFLVIALGYVAGRMRVFAADELRVLGRFVINFALPALLFNALASRPVAEVLNPVYLVAYAAGSVAVVLGAFAFARRVRGRSAPESAFIAMGMGFSNTGFVGYPVVLQFLGPPAAVALALSMIVENLLILPLTLALAESGGGDGARWHRALAQSLRRLAANPLVLAIVAGFVVALSGLALPRPLTRTIDLFAQASTALALFVIGGSLAGLEVRGMVRDVAAIAVGKLVLHPLAVIAALALLPPMDPTLRLACIAFACMPMLSVYPILAQRYRLEGLCAAALLVTTVASFFTISAILWMVGPMRQAPFLDDRSTHYNRRMDPSNDLERITLQERRLVLERFDAATAWTLGTMLKASAEARGAALAIEVRIARRTVFFHAMPGSKPSNADWARRKRNTVELLARSSYAAGLAPPQDGQTIAQRMGLATRDYAFAGGGFPIAVAATGVIGAVAVSGLPQRDDHEMVVAALAELAGVPLAEVALNA